MEDRQISCCFSGHRPSKLPWGHDESDPACVQLKEEINGVLSNLYERGFRHFICGMAQGCDMYFGEAVAEAKLCYPDITLEAAIPYEAQADKYSPALKSRYDDILSMCDKRTVMCEKYERDCMLRRNQYMVDSSSVLIAVLDDTSGGTFSTVKYARSKKLEIVMLKFSTEQLRLEDL